MKHVRCKKPRSLVSDSGNAPRFVKAFIEMLKFDIATLGNE